MRPRPAYGAVLAVRDVAALQCKTSMPHASVAPINYVSKAHRVLGFMASSDWQLKAWENS